MPTINNTVEAAAFAAAQMNTIAIADGAPPIPDGFVCMGRGGDRLVELRERYLLSGYGLRSRSGQGNFSYGDYNGALEDYFYYLTTERFNSQYHLFAGNIELFLKHLNPEPEPEKEPERVVLEVGKCYRRRDGRVVLMQAHNPGSTYPWVAGGYTYDSMGCYHGIHQQHQADLMEECEQPESRVSPIVLKVGGVYRNRNGNLVGPIVEGSGGSMFYGGYHYSKDGFYCTYDNWTLSDDDLVEEVVMPENSELSGIELSQLNLIPSVTEGFTGWRYLGSRVNKSFKYPWVYFTTGNNWGAIKSNGQRLGGSPGHYFEMIPESPSGDSIPERKVAASNKAYGKYWAASCGVSNAQTSVGLIAVTEYLNTVINGDVDRTVDGLVHMSWCDENTANVLTYDQEKGEYKTSQMTWGRAHAAFFGEDSTDESRRQFLKELDLRINQSRVTVEWSTVDDTYRTPMAGWRDGRAVTGSCMEKFCDDGNHPGHAVFDLYERLESKGFLQMIKIYIAGDYVGRAICWKGNYDNGWTMDRVYCRDERGVIPPDVIEALAKFAVEENILNRFEKCGVTSLEAVSAQNITCSGLDQFDYYPYLDTYESVGRNGLFADGSGQISCDDADGDPLNNNESNENESNEIEVYGRNNYYDRDNCTWSEYHNAYLYDDDVTTVDGHGAVHCDETVEDYRGNYILREDSVELGEDSGEYAASDDEDLVEVHFGNRRSTVYAIRA
jgi:hypothetical protein